MIRLAAALIASSLMAPVALASDIQPASKPIDVVLCLDTSNSMDGLIASAKIKLWDIVNDLAKAKPTPNLRVALYSYGNNGYDAGAGWVRKEIDLTTDLDEIYRKLNALTTNGGEEYVGRVCRDALANQKWSADPAALKIIFVCGNEPASQDPLVKLSAVVDLAKSRNVIINPIFCGPSQHRDARDWKELASTGGGRFASIDQDRGTVTIATPFDKPLAELSAKLNATYLGFGRIAQEKLDNQREQDSNALRLSPAAAASRATSKAGALYRNSDWDLVDRCKEDPKFDVSTVPETDLPEDMRKLKPAERAAYVKKKADERGELQKQIADVTAKRDQFVRDEQRKSPSAADKAFDAAIRGMLKDQAAAMGIDIP